MATVAANGAAGTSQEKSSGPHSVPLAAPTPESKPYGRPALTADEKEKYSWLLEQVKAYTDITSEKGTSPLTDEEKQWLTRECLLRYLRATKWNQKDAEKRLRDTLIWRREYGVAELTPEHISPENETGKQVLLGFDKQGRPCHYLNPGRQNTSPSPRQVQHLVYMLERVIDMMPAQVETLSLMINFKQSKSRSNTAPGIGQAREVLHILQNHYPERLGKALIINVPWVVNGFFKLITPFIDPLTREKLKFNEDMSQYVPKEQLWTEFNGSLEFEYDHSVYWPALIRMCEEKRQARTQRWIAGGKQIGELEDYLAGHLEQGVAPPAPAPAPAAAPASEAEVVKAVEELKISEPVVAAPVSKSDEEVKVEAAPASAAA